MNENSENNGPIYTGLLENWERNTQNISEREICEWKERIKKVLHSFGIEVLSISATPQLSVTYYEVIPVPGFCFLELKEHLVDFAISLGEFSARTIVPVFGKVAIGIEIPNKKQYYVSAKELFASDSFTKSMAILPIALGKTHSNQYHVTDLTELNHILIAGATGTGKSICLKTILTGLLCKKNVSELKLVLIDPKKVEFNEFASLNSNFFAKEKSIDSNIITDIKQSARMLDALKKEMDKRYDLLKKTTTNNIEEYNKQQTKEGNDGLYQRMPYIVVIIDEFGDLMMTSRNEVEYSLRMLAALSHKVGIHLIMATQRPTNDIVTGGILALFSTHLVFKMSSSYDSERIIGQSDASFLIGNGDMFISNPSEDIIRSQGAYISDEEISRIVNEINKHFKYSDSNNYYLP